jgi:DNA-binding transcriptional MocR family regulator
MCRRNDELRHAIARRYALQGMNISPDDIVITARALAYNISIAPGKMFSTRASWTSFFRFNTAWGWGEREELGVKQLGDLIREMLA